MSLTHSQLLDVSVDSNLFPQLPEGTYLSFIEKEQLMEGDALSCCVQDQETLRLTGFGGLLLSIGCSAFPLITGVSLDKSKGKIRKDNPPLTLPHELSLILKSITIHQVQERCVSVVPDGHHRCPSEVCCWPSDLGGQEGRINLSKVQRLQGSSLVGRLYKYLLNKTLPVNW